MPTTPPSSTSPATPATDVRPRIGVLDGLRGLAIVLVVLSHGWVLWPTEFFDERWWARPVMRSGNASVTIFLVAGGFLTYRVLARGSLERMRPGVALVRRVLRVAPSLWLMLAVLMLVTWLFPNKPTSGYDDTTSVVHVLTYTWNWYVQGNLLQSRPDFGHLWYLSVDMQAFVIVTVLLYAVRRQPIAVLAVLSGFYLLLTWWRFHVSETEYVFQVLVRTTARMDAFVLGVLVAAALPFLARLDASRRFLDVLTITSLVATAACFWWVAADPFGQGDGHFLGLGGTCLQLSIATVVGATALGGRPPRWLVTPRLVSLGRNSLLLYIWHYPVFVLTTAYTPDTSWWWRTVIGLPATVLVCVAAHWLLERRVTRLLGARAWRHLDDGFPALGRRLVTRSRRDREPAGV